MSILLWCNHPRYAVSNDELWQQFFETSSVEEQDYLLLLILTNAEDNDERKGVCSNTDDPNIKAEALFAMVPHAHTLEDLGYIADRITGDMPELREKLIAKTIDTYRTKFQLARSNRHRWYMHNRLDNDTLRNLALSEILAHSDSVFEKWSVLISATSPTLKKQALFSMGLLHRIKKK